MLEKWASLKTSTSVSGDWMTIIASHAFAAFGMKQNPGICFFMTVCKIRNIAIGISRNCHTLPSVLESSSDDQFGVLWEPSFAKAAHGLCKEVTQVLLILGVVYVLGPLVLVSKVHECELPVHMMCLSLIAHQL